MFLQKTLDNVQNTWNNHKIRKSPNQNIPNGRPHLLYSSPHIVGAQNFMCPVTMEEVIICEEECQTIPLHNCDETVDELCQLLVDEQNLQNYYATEDTAVDSKIEIYKHLRSQILESLDHYVNTV